MQQESNHNEVPNPRRQRGTCGSATGTGRTRAAGRHRERKKTCTTHPLQQPTTAHGSAAAERTAKGSENIPWVVIVVDDVGVVGTRTRHADRCSDRAGGGLARHRRNGAGRPEERHGECHGRAVPPRAPTLVDGDSEEGVRQKHQVKRVGGPSGTCNVGVAWGCCRKQNLLRRGGGGLSPYRPREWSERHGTDGCGWTSRGPARGPRCSTAGARPFDWWIFGHKSRKALCED